MIFTATRDAIVIEIFDVYDFDFRLAYRRHYRSARI